MDLEQPGLPDSSQTLDPSAGGQSTEVIVDTDLENQPEQVEEFEDIELDDGVKKVPKSLKDYVMRTKDYTLKTQEIAEQRRQIEVERQQDVQRQQFHQANLQDIAKVMSIDERLEQFKALNWDALNDADPQQAAKLERSMRLLKDQRTELAQKISQSQQTLGLHAQRETAKRMQEAETVLAREIPNWSKPEVKQGIAKAAKAVGYTDEMLARTDFAPFIKLAHKAFLYDQLAKERTKPAEPAKPTTRATGGAPATTGFSPTMTDAQFAKMRRAQISQRH